MSTAISATVPCPNPVHAPPDDADERARRWIEQHHDDLARLTRHLFRHHRPQTREEAVAECLAQSCQAALGAARRGTLDRLTPSTCVSYAARQFRGGRRFAGYSSTCVMGAATQVRRGVRVRSLDEPITGGTTTFADALADRDTDTPLEQLRRRRDYPGILDRERVSAKARRTFAFLAATRGAGRQRDLASMLSVSPGRITQLKAELATALARHGYAGPLGPRPSAG